MIPNKLGAGGWLALILLLAGCGNRTQYGIEMQPGEEGLVRTFSARGTDEIGVVTAQEPRIEGVTLEELYHAFEDQEYRGTFLGDLPAEFGGAGVYLTWPTELGTAHLYAERVQGSLDLWEHVSAIERESDRAADRLLGWLHHEFGREEWFDALRSRLDVELRHDLKNFALYVALAMAVDGDEAEQITWAFLGGQYLVERGYLDPRELPRYYRLLETGPATELEEATPYALLHALLAESARADHPLVRFLATPEAALASYRAWYREHALVDPDAKLPDGGPLTPFDDYVATMFAHLAIDLFGTADDVEMSLETGVEPFLTNGEWDETAGGVRWAPARLDAERLPAVFRIAAWIVPDENAQRRILGTVSLTDDDLWEHAMWRHGLTPAEEVQWDEVLRNLAADPAAAEHFASLPFVGEVGPYLEQEARKLLAIE